MSSTNINSESKYPLWRGCGLRWRSVADRMARAGLTLLAVATLLGLISGSIIAFVWRPDVDWQSYNQPFIAQFLGYIVAISLGVPSLLAGGWDALHGRWSQSAAGLLPFTGPIVILLGTAEGSHLLIRCDITPFICQDGDIYDRWHQLHHTLVAGVPLLLIYWRAWLMTHKKTGG